jgi:molybdopterin converting factor subunit 1
VKISVLYFAAIRDLVGKDEEVLELPAEIRTVDALAVHLSARHATLVGRLGSVRFARNEEFAQGGDALHDGDVVALIPPVAGG